MKRKDTARKEALMNDIKKMEEEYFSSCHLKENLGQLMELRYRIKQAQERLREIISLERS